MKTILNKEKPFIEFKVYGDCYTCIKGTGTVSILRKLGDTYEVITDPYGNPRIYLGQGVLFNDVLSSRKKLPYKIEAEGDIEITLIHEDR
jgi:hypothetical protein